MGKILFLITVLSLYLVLRNASKKNRVIPGDRKYVHNSTETTEKGNTVNITTRKDLMCW